MKRNGFRYDIADDEEEGNKKISTYKMALEEGIGKKVKEAYIYSLYLDKEISL